MRVAAPQLILPLLLLTMLAARQPVSAQPATEGTVRLQPPTTTDARVDDPFSVFIGLEEMQHQGLIGYDDDDDDVPDRFEPSDGLGAFEFTIRFDPALLEIHAAESGSLLNSTGRSFQCFQRSDKPAGSFSFGCVSTGGDMPGPEGTFTLAQVSFRPIEAGSSLLQLENVDLGGPLADDIPVVVFGVSAVSVTGPAPDQTQPAPRATSAPEPTNVPADPAATPGPEISTAAPLQTPVVAATEALVEIELEDEGASPTSVAPLTNAGAQNQASPGGGGDSSRNIVLWSAAAVGGVVVAGALGLTLVLWRRNQRL